MSLLKGKGSLYLLAPLNLLIWGYMAYKFYMSLGEPAPEDSLLPTAPPPVSQARDSQQYVLSLNYKDPFLKQEPVFHSKITAEKKPSASAKKQTAEVPRPAPIDIRYLGLVKNTSSGTITAMILLNGSPLIVKPGQTINQLQFRSFTAEQLVLQSGKEQVVIKR